MQTATKPGMWAQTPLAIFPPILGLFGLGLAWRRATLTFPVPGQIGEMILGAVTLLFLFAVLAYLAKFLRRPTALTDDLHILPGRAGASAGSASAMLMAAALAPYSVCLAKGTLLAAVAAHAVIAFLVIIVLLPAPLPQRRMTAVWQLTFVGFIVAPIAAVPLGWPVMSEIILVLTLPMAITIWLGHAYTVRKTGVPAPLRPTLAIHLAPVSIFGIVCVLLGYNALATGFAWLAILVAAALLLRTPYLTAAGFSPLWGAFTFPIVAFTNLMLMLAVHGGIFKVIGGLMLIAGTIVIPIIAYRIMKMWADGSLATKTNASKV